ncbi:MAG: Serine/threonine-protein kinase PknD [Phycisphaerae bacterium]|nr:Serine/threonine-protein kinase PknD [Phycisphaerae bacterium]
MLEDVLRRREAGEFLADAAVFEAHPDLLPELEEELKLLRLMESAANRAGSSDGLTAGRMSGSRSAVLKGTWRGRRRWDPSFCELDPEAIPGFRIERELHRGGQGVVYRAVDVVTGRSVGIKVTRDGPFGGAHDRVRFEREVRLLERLHHPNIITVRSSGVAAGRFYFIMDYIEGLRLEEWAAGAGTGSSSRSSQNGSSVSPGVRPTRPVNDVVSVFATVCEAIHAAHVRGVIHRDLKPGNILVDAGGRPYVLDFGLAKAFGEGSHHGNGAETVTGQFVGSLPWAAPEQVVGSSSAVDTRTDVYALGVVLYQALTGRFPYEVYGPIAQVTSNIVNVVPPSPSVFRPELNEDVCTLVLRCLQKEPERRYQTAGEVARDARRYLAGDPIEARRDSTWYLIRTQLRRHRWAAAFAGTMLLFVFAFAAYAGVQARNHAILAEQEKEARIEAEAARRSAQSAQADAESAALAAARAAEEADDAALRARHETERAQAVTRLLVSALGLTDPNVSRRPDLTLVEVLDDATAQVESASWEAPGVEAEVRSVLGQAYASLGLLGEARRHLARAVEILRSSEDTAAQKLYDSLWPFYHVQTDWNDVWAHYFGWELQALGARILTERSGELGEVLQRVRVTDDPAQLRDELAAMRETASRILAADDPAWLLVADQLYLFGYRRSYRNDPVLGCALLDAALEHYRERLPETHMRIVRTLGVLIPTSLDAGLAVEAEALARRTLDLLREVLPADHWYVDAHEVRLAACLVAQGRLDEAETALKANLTTLENTLGASSSYVAEAHRGLIELYEARGETGTAEAHRWEFARCMTLSTLAPSWSETSSRWMYCAVPACGKEYEALHCAMDDLHTALVEKSPDTGARALALVETRRKLLSDEHPLSGVVADVMTTWMNHYQRTVPRESALALLEDSVRVATRNPWMNPRKVASAHWWYGSFLMLVSRHDEAERHARECLSILSGLVDQDYSYRAVARSLLGGCLIHQARYEEAEELLVDAYSEMVRALGPDDANTNIALNRLLRLYMLTDRPGFALATCRDHVRRSRKPATLSETIFSAMWSYVVRTDTSETTRSALLEMAAIAVDGAPDHPSYLSMYGAAKLRTGWPDAALELLDQARKTPQGGGSGNAAFTALTYQALGRWEEAEEWRKRFEAFLKPGSKPSENFKLLRAEIQEGTARRAGTTP